MTLPAFAHTEPPPRLLFVDDEPAVLEALAVNLRRGFEVVTVTSGEDGLEYLRAQSDFAVVVSDMRMPKMDGATFLARAREIAPDVVRILLTGQTDLDAAIKAVNHGQLFRFLTKPCPRDTLRSAIDSAVVQHRLINAERVLLEQTLRGSIKMLVDILAITSPAAFGRANQIKTRVLQLGSLLGILDSWQLEIAALASQLGYIVLPHELCEKLEAKRALTDDEQRMVERAPAMTEQLLTNIPRLEGVRSMLALHVKPPKRKLAADPATQLVELGAHLLRVAIDIETLESS
ncbi:MAG: response regulator, partial [bacterium]